MGANVPNLAHLVDRFDDVRLSEVCYPLSGCFDQTKPTQAQVIFGRYDEPNFSAASWAGANYASVVR